jgi:hypothetical protein
MVSRLKEFVVFSHNLSNNHAAMYKGLFLALERLSSLYESAKFLVLGFPIFIMIIPLDRTASQNVIIIPAENVVVTEAQKHCLDEIVDESKIKAIVNTSKRASDLTFMRSRVEGLEIKIISSGVYNELCRQHKNQ